MNIRHLLLLSSIFIALPGCGSRHLVNDDQFMEMIDERGAIIAEVYEKDTVIEDSHIDETLVFGYRLFPISRHASDLSESPNPADLAEINRLQVENRFLRDIIEETNLEIRERYKFEPGKTIH
jgi:hypothetical protein